MDTSIPPAIAIANDDTIKPKQTRASLTIAADSSGAIISLPDQK
jgi:hypothetical protein